MTSILVQAISTVDKVHRQIKKTPNRFLDISKLKGGDLTNIIPYQKPVSTPKPKLSTLISVDEVKPLQKSKEAMVAKAEFLYDIGKGGRFLCLHVRTCCLTKKKQTPDISHVCAAVNAGVNVIVVCSPNVDVLMILLHHWPSVKAKQLHFLTERRGKHTNLTKFIPIHTLYTCLAKVMVPLDVTLLLGSLDMERGKHLDC